MPVLRSFTLDRFLSTKRYYLIHHSQEGNPEILRVWNFLSCCHACCASLTCEPRPSVHKSLHPYVGERRQSAWVLKFEKCSATQVWRKWGYSANNPNMRIRMPTHMCLCLCVCVCTCVCVYVCARACVYVRVRVCVWVCLCVYVYAYAYKYVLWCTCI